MSDPIIIERSELKNIIDRSIYLTLNELGIKRKPLKPFVSEHHAVKVMGINLARLKDAAERGIVERKLILEKQTHNRFYRRSDIQKLLNDPAL
jgi:hypothetical protein